MVATNKTGSVTSQVVRVHVIDMAFEPDNGAQGIHKPTGSSYMVLSWPSISNRYYDILWSTNLMSGTASFITIASNLPSATPFNIYTDTVHSAQPVGYYRIKSKESP